jgi:putative lipase involved disintegration of autophagic bodies
MEPFSGCNKCYIHVGFNQDYHLNAKKINDHLQVLIKSYQVSKIIVTGHSLGAALASINAVHIVMSGVKIPV